MKFGEVVDSLMAGKPVTRKFFREEDQTQEPYIRYGELWDKFEIVQSEMTVEVEYLRLNSEMLHADDWIVGEFDPRTGECKYENDK